MNLYRKSWLMIVLLLLIGTACGQQSVEVTPTPAPVVQAESEVVAPPTPETAVAAQDSDPVPTSEPEPEPEPIPGPADLQAATVQIYAKLEERDQLQTQWTGSGTIVSPDGLILTNAHVASPLSPGLAALYNDSTFIFGDEPEALVVGIVESADLPPVETYFAEVVATDGALDLAVIRITSTLDGQPVDGASLNLPYVQLGDSDTLNLGDEIQIFGFPGAGGETITFTRGDVSGFEQETRIGTRAWIKTDTVFSPGNSGGLGANSSGQIVGVPSFVLEAQGGSINRLRSINYAVPLIEAAQNGEPYVSPFVSPGTGNETLELVTWAYDFDEETKCAIDPVKSFPSGALAVVAIFEYSGMSDGEQVAIVWFEGDEFVGDQILTWEFGESGDCFAVYLHNFGDEMADGAYGVEIYTGDDVRFTSSAEVTVGGTTAVSSSGSGGQINISGQITDADSGKPIEGAVIILLNPGTDLDAWLDDPQDADIYTFAETNGKGQYTLPQPLERNVEYPGVAWKEGYRTNEGFLLFDDSYDDNVVLDLTLNK